MSIAALEGDKLIRMSIVMRLATFNLHSSCKLDPISQDVQNAWHAPIGYFAKSATKTIETLLLFSSHFQHLYLGLFAALIIS